MSGVHKQPVGAHYGLRDWLSCEPGPVLRGVLVVLWHGGLDYPAWRALFADSLFRIATFLFMASLVVHAWVGVRNILMDYVKPASLRLSLEVAVVCMLVAYAGWTIQVLWGPA